MSALELCENCGRQIGRLEQAYSWDNHVVCAGCQHVLSAQSRLSAESSSPGRSMTLPPIPPLRHARKATPAPDAEQAPAPVAAQDETPPAAPAAVMGQDVDACAACGAVFPKTQLLRDADADGNIRRVCPPCSIASAAAAKAARPVRESRQQGPPRLAIAAALILMGAAAWGATYLLAPEFPQPQQHGSATGPGTAGGVAPGMSPAKPNAATASPNVAAHPAPVGGAATPPPPHSTLFSDEAVGSASSAPRRDVPETNADPIDMTPAPAPSRAVAPAANARVTTDPSPAAVGPASPPAAVAEAEPETPAPDPASLETPVDRRSTVAQLALGTAALQSSDFKRAAQAFKDALDGQKDSAQALHGLALANWYVGERAKGVGILEKASVERADRAIVHNVATMHLQDRNPMRAGKFIRDYLQRPGVPLDEPLQNVLGAALAAAGDDARTGALYAELREFYFQYDTRLAAGRADGKKRWGMTWIPAGQADYKWKVSKARAEEFERLRISAGRASVRKKRAREAIHDFNTSMALHTDDEQRAVWMRMEGAVKDERAAHKTLDAARNLLDQTEMPPFPKDFQFIPIDALTPDKHPPQL